MAETVLTSKLLDPVTVISHNGYKTVILRQGKNAVILTDKQIVQLSELYYKAGENTKEKVEHLRRQLEASQIVSVEEEQKRKQQDQ